MENTSLKRDFDSLNDGNSCDCDKKKRKVDWDTVIRGLGYSGGDEEMRNLSKRQKKKLAKRLMWQGQKAERRKQEKLKRRIRQKKHIEALTEQMNMVKLDRQALKNNSMAESRCKLAIVVDLSFDALMSEKDLQKCIQQVNRCYCANRRVKDPVQFHVTNFNGRAKDVMEKNTGYNNWDVKFHEEGHLDVFEKERLVYLTSDSENIITELDENKVYIIGGLVDHNCHKNMCYRQAVDQGIEHGRLPLDDFVKMNSRKVLTINHVFEILLKVKGGTMEWGKAFLEVLPQRKGAKPKQKDKTIPFVKKENKPITHTSNNQENNIYDSMNIEDNATLVGRINQDGKPINEENKTNTYNLKIEERIKKEDDNTIFNQLPSFEESSSATKTG